MNARIPQCRICGNTPKFEVVFADGMIYMLCDVDVPRDADIAAKRELDYAERHGMTDGDV